MMAGAVSRTSRILNRFRRFTAFQRSIFSIRKEKVTLLHRTCCTDKKCREIKGTSFHQRICNSPFPDVEIEGVSLLQYLLPKIESYGNKTALVESKTGKKLTYLELRDAIVKVGSALSRLGYRKGDVICIISTNNIEFAILILACVMSGVTLTTINPTYTSGEIARHLSHSNTSGVVVLEAIMPNLRAALASDSNLGKSVKNIFVIGEADGCRPFSSLLDDNGDWFPYNQSIDPNSDVCLLPYSSGTTGLPKGVMLTHNNISSNLQQTRLLLEVSSDDTVVCVLPMYHVCGMVLVLMHTVQGGGQVVILPQFEPESFLTALEHYRVSILHMVPPIAMFLASNPMVERYDLSSINIHISGAAPAGRVLCTEYGNRLKHPLIQSYGMTELSPIATSDTLPPHNVGTVGKLIPNTKAKIVCQRTEKVLGPHESGEICIQGPQMMKGYFNNEKATAEIIRDGWLHTGDIGQVDEDGCFVITDRLKELIKYKGFQVAPAELEDVLIKHPMVQDAAVIGIPDKRAGELPRAYVVPKPNMKVTADDISYFIEENCAPYKQLRGGIKFIEEVPRSTSGKILRRLLRDVS